MPISKQIKYPLIISFLSLEKTTGRGYNTGKEKLNGWEEKKDEYISLDYCARLGSLDSSLGRLMVEEGLEETRS